MGQQLPPAPNQFTLGSKIIFWIIILLFLISGIFGVYAIIMGQNIVYAVISFLLVFFMVPINILQVNRHLFTKIQTSFKTDKLAIMIAVLFVLLIALFITNISLILRPPLLQINDPRTPIVLPSVAHSPIPTAPTSTSTPAPTPTPPIQKPILVDSNFANGSTFLQVPAHFHSAVTKGNLIVVAITQWIGTVTSVVDNTGDVYTSATSAQYADSSQDYVELYYAKNVNGGNPKITVTFSTVGDSNNSNDMNVGIYEFSGIDKTNPIDQQPVSQVGYSSTPDGGTISSTAASDLYFVVGVDNDNNKVSPTVGSGYTLLDHQDSSDNERFYTEYRVAPAGSYQTNFSIDASSSWAVIGVSFKSA